MPVAERRDLRRPQRRAAAPDSATRGPAAAEDELLELQHQAGNKAIADLLAKQETLKPPVSPAVQLRDNLRSERPAVQREFGLVVQRQDAKQARPTVRLGSRGADVAALQQLLGLAADGIFGPVTLKAVIRFQAQAGLAADGIVGPLTWSALSLGKQPSDKLPSEEPTDKLADEQSVKGIPTSTDKLAEEQSVKGIPTSTDKLAEWEEETSKL